MYAGFCTQHMRVHETMQTSLRLDLPVAAVSPVATKHAQVAHKLCQDLLACGKQSQHQLMEVPASTVNKLNCLPSTLLLILAFCKQA